MKSIMRAILLFALLAAASIGLTLPTAAQQGTCDPAVDYLKLGNEQYNSGDYQGAVDSFTCALERVPSSASTYNGRGNAYRNLGSYNQALADYGQAIQLEPEFALAYNNRGWIYYQLSDYQRALSDLNRAIELDPELAYAYNNRGLTYQALRDFDRAIADFNKAIELGHDPLVWPQFNLEQVLLEREKLGTVTPPIVETATPDPEQALADAIAEASRIYSTGDCEASVAAYTRVIELDPQNADAYFGRGYCYGEIGQFDLAIEDNTMAIELNYDPLEWAYHNRGWDYAQIRQYANAVENYDLALELAPDYALATFNRSFALGELGRYEEAIDGANQALELGYDNTHQVYNNIGWYYQQLGDLNTAIINYDLSLGVNPDYTIARRNRADLYRSLGDYEKAIADYTRALELEPSVPSTYLSRAQAYLKSGNDSAAAADFTAWMSAGESERVEQPAIVSGESRMLDMVRGRIYAIPLEGESGQTISITAASGTVDSLLVLLGVDGMPLTAADDISADNLSASLVNYTLPETGTYTLLVTHAGSGFTGTIDLRYGGALSVDVMMDMAAESVRQGSYEQAVATYTEVLGVQPDNFDAYYNRGDAYFLLGEYQQAINDFSRAIEIDPTVVDAYHYRGVAHERLGEHSLALASYNQAIEIDPAYMLSYFGRGNAYAALDEHENAIAAFDSVLQLDPEYADAYRNRGLSYEALGQYENAIADYNQAMTLDPTSIDLEYDRAGAYLSLEKYDEALADYNAVIGREAQDSGAYLGRGIAYLGLGDRVKAAQDFMTWFGFIETGREEGEPINLGDLITLEMVEGKVYYLPFAGESGQMVTFRTQSEAVDSLLVILDPEGVPLTGDDDGGEGFNALIDSFRLPANGDYTLVLGHAGAGSEGEVLLGFGADVSFPEIIDLEDLIDRADQRRRDEEYDLAIVDYLQVIERDPRNTSAYFNLGYSYGETGQYQEAIDAYQLALEYGYSTPERVYNNLGWSYRHLDQYDQAIANYSRAIELDPTYARPYYGRGYTYARMDEYETAIADYDEALELGYHDPASIYYDRANAYLNLEEWALAKADYNAVISDDADLPGPYLGRGITYIGLGDRKEAATDFMQWFNLVQEDKVEGAAIEPGDTVTLAMIQGRQYYIPFSGKAGQIVTFTANSEDVDSLLVILDADGSPLTGDDDDGEVFNAIIDGFELPDDAGYTLVVGHAGGGREGDIELTFVAPE